MDIGKFSTLWSSISFPQIDSILSNLEHNCFIDGIVGSSDAFLISDLFHKTNKSILVITESSKKAETLADECRTFLDDESVLLFPSRDAVPYNMKSPFGPLTESRFRVLTSLLNGKKCITITPFSSLLQKITPRKKLFNSIIRLQTGDDVAIETLSQWFTDSGFHRETQVSDIGTFCVRGGIVDIYPFLYENPIRIEFWGNYIESIRDFDVFTQKSLDLRKSVEIVPMKEFLFTSEDIETALEQIEEFIENNKIDSNFLNKIEHQWKIAGDHEGIEWFLHWFKKPFSSIFDYFPSDTFIIWDDMISPSRRLDETRQNYIRHLERIPEIYKPLVSQPDNLLLNQNQIEDEIDLFKTVYLNTLDIRGEFQKFKIDIVEQPQLPNDLDSLSANFSQYEQTGFRIVLLCPNIGHAERMQELFGDQCPYVEIAIGFLVKGFIAKEIKFLIYSEGQILNRVIRPVKIKKQKSGIPLTGFDALSPQDYVVHEDHGIAQFLGVERIATQDFQKDCMVLLYADGAKVYVPVEDFHKVQKYVGKDTVVPSLSKIGTSAWEKLKTRTRESLKEMAQELIDLYAKRQFLEGIRFQPDNLWQKEFEDSFIYDETPDQLKAIKEIKEDMESNKPMDRLICGDVGFGKTEVSMRAAFKAVMSGYQVAVLAPTTILAAQHFSTFSERMSNFPVRVSMLSRFLKPKEQKPILEKIKEGNVDIVIGTHRILSDDISFKNLGLLIVDEEQRFGVKHKEKLKHLKFGVDVLSMTATPIPRTLHMSLIGARDLSIINTPPRNRLPIETKVSEYHDELVKSAIENELDRGGQIYFVNNRIKNLEQIKEKIEILVPRARVVIAHGQTDETELEIVMKEFIAGRYDILLSTVIIENGLDISNVNTIIVNRADSLGLSQLYQLRGRVGRSSEQAFAYFLTPEFKQMNDLSLKRLRALEQYTDLGSGFQIAMRDLEIRGAGNILGNSQHGFIAAVGFELYCRLLQDAVKELKGENIQLQKKDVKVEIPLEAYIPIEYIADGATRIAVYQELSSISTIEGITDVEKSLNDRFGSLPKSVNSLLLLMRIKILAKEIGASKISINRNNELAFFFDGEQVEIQTNIKKLFEAYSLEFKISNEIPVAIRTILKSNSIENQVIETIGILEIKEKTSLSPSI
jgi:transcription-repair coupling factor (superfamily II helicase)